jgi:N-acetylglucosamine-6-sulfatase
MGVGQVPDSVQGTDHSDILLGREGTRPTSALYLNVMPEDPAGGSRGVRTHRHTCVVTRTGEAEETILHDNIADPYQLQNIAGDHPGLVTELKEEMNTWLSKTGDPWLCE